MIVGVRTIPSCFDVEQHRYVHSRVAYETHVQAYDGLLRHPVRIDPAGYRTIDTETVEPALAQRYDVSRDGKVYNFFLRPSVLSRDGHELTAHDVKWSWERAFALNSWSARLARQAGVPSPDSIRVAQNNVVQFQLERPNVRFPLFMAGPLLPVYDLQTVRDHCPLGDPWGNGWLSSHTAGFGAYELGGIVPGEEAVLVANEHYWQGTPRIRRLLLRAVNGDDDRANALRSGSIDAAEDLASCDAQRLSECPDVRLTSFSSERQILLRIDPAFAPFDQPRVRQAMTHAMPYDDIAGLLRLTKRPATSQQDHKLSRSLLREAGYSAGFRVSLYIPDGFNELASVAQAIQRDSIRLDLKMVVEKLPLRSFAERKGSRHLPFYLEERSAPTYVASAQELEPQPEVEEVVLGNACSYFAARLGVEGLIRRPDGRPRYFELKKS